MHVNVGSCAYVYVRMYIYIYICTGICVYIHMYIHICLYVPVHVRPVGVGRVGGVAALARARAWAGPEC
jgi:hypothetical protein